MKTTSPYFATKIIALLLAPAIVSISAAQAADMVPWDDLPKKIGQGKLRSDGRESRIYSVIAKDGSKQIGSSLIFTPREVLLNGSFRVPRSEVAEIRIHRHDAILDVLAAPVVVLMKPFDGGCAECITPGTVTMIVLAPLWIPPALAVMAAASPVTLSIEGIRRLLPDKVIHVAP